jgi:hypothetical protein
MIMIRRFSTLAAPRPSPPPPSSPPPAAASEARALAAAMDAVRAATGMPPRPLPAGPARSGATSSNGTAFALPKGRFRRGRGLPRPQSGLAGARPPPKAQRRRCRISGGPPRSWPSSPTTPPQTGAGSIALAAALEALGRKAEAEAQIVLAWRTQRMTTGDEASLLQRYGALLRPHHEARLDMLLWTDQPEAAQRLLPRVSEGWQKLARARMALRAEAPGVDTLIAAVPALAGDPGLAFERYQWRARKGRNADAIELALSRERRHARPSRGLGDWRAPLARWAIREGRPRDAYRIAARHGLTEGSITPNSNGSRASSR